MAMLTLFLVGGLVSAPSPSPYFYFSPYPVPMPVVEHHPSDQPMLVQFSTIGLPANRLFAAGMSGQELGAASERLGEAAEALDAYTAARATLDGIERQLASATREFANGGEGAVVATLDSQVQVLRAQVAQQRQSLRATVLGETTQERAGLLDRSVRGINFGLPPDLALAANSDGERRKLAMALKAEARRQRMGGTEEAPWQQTLATARAQPAVSSAASRLNTDWPAVRAALSATSEAGPR